MREPEPRSPVKEPALMLRQAQPERGNASRTRQSAHPELVEGRADCRVHQAASAPATSPALARWVWWMLGALIVATYLGGLGAVPLTEPDEARYAEIPREMIERNDWVTPHLNYVKYFEKPPLVYWLTAVNFALFGDSAYVARVWPALCALLVIGVAYALGRAAYGPWVGAAAAVVLAAAPYHFVLSQVLILDMVLAAALTVALAAFWFAYGDAARRRRWVVVLYAATGLGVLTKGPVAVVLVGATVALFVAVRREWGILRWAIAPIGIVVFLAVTLPWFVLVSHRNPEFLQYFVVHEHLQRYLKPDEHRAPVWYYVPFVLGGLLPWTLVAACAPQVVRDAVGRLLRGRVGVATQFLVCWCVVVFGFFSLSRSKLGTYVLPMFCPLAVLMGAVLRDLLARGEGRALQRAYAITLAIAAVGVLGVPVAAALVRHPGFSAVAGWICAATALFGAGAAAAITCVRRGRLAASLLVLAIGVLGAQGAAIPARALGREHRAMGLLIREQARPDDLVVIYRSYVQGIAFYARRRTVLVRGRGELRFGSQQGDQRAYFWDTDEQLVEAWRSGHRMFLVGSRHELQVLVPQLVPAPRQLMADRKKVLWANF